MTRPSLGAVTWIGVGLVTGFVLLATLGRLVAPSPTELVADPLLSPSSAHPLGTDNLGRDLLARTASGAWTSLVVAVAAVGLALAVALPLSTVAARARGRWPDHVLLRGVEALQVVPPFVLVVVLLGLTGRRTTEILGVTTTPTARLVACLALAFVPHFARVIRSAVLQELGEGYVAGLRLLGVGEREVLFREVLPNAAPVVGVQVLLALAIAVFAEGGLSFLGLGVPAPQPTLGNLVAEAGGQLLDGAWWFAVIPGLVLVAGITGCNLVGDAVSDRLVRGDP